MFDITPLEFMHGAIFLLGILAKGGLITLVPLVIDQIVFHGTGYEYLAAAVLAVITFVNLSNLRYVGIYESAPSKKRPLIYKGRRRMTMSPDRIKARIQAEIDAVYDEAWFHNLVLDTRKKLVDATDRVNHVVPENWNWI